MSYIVTVQLGRIHHTVDIPSSEDDVTTSDNPFLTASTLPYQLPPYDRIKESHYRPAFDAGMADQLAEIEMIANGDTPPTVENTIVAIERSGQLLTRVSDVFFALSSADSTDELNAIEVGRRAIGRRQGATQSAQRGTGRAGDNLWPAPAGRGQCRGRHRRHPGRTGRPVGERHCGGGRSGGIAGPRRSVRAAVAEH